MTHHIGDGRDAAREKAFAVAVDLRARPTAKFPNVSAVEPW
jgi:hypothetical protein